MAELADARDLKSLGPKDRTGSIPVFGTNFKTDFKKVGFLLLFEDRNQNNIVFVSCLTIFLLKTEYKSDPM